MLQYASVNTISHAVRTSGEATEDPLKLEFLSSFRSNQHMMIAENVCVFAIESQSEDESTRDRSVLHMQMDICSYFLNISCHFFNIYRYAIDCAS